MQKASEKDINLVFELRKKVGSYKGLPFGLKKQLNEIHLKVCYLKKKAFFNKSLIRKLT